MKICLRFGTVAFLIYIIILAKPGTSLFSFHPFCMALAYGVLMTEGVLIFTSRSLFHSKTPQSTLLYYHWLLNTLAGIVASVGFVLMYWNKTRKGMEHFVTYHGLLGLICVVYTLVQLIAGLSLKYPSYLPKWLKLKVVKNVHRISGLLSYSLGIISLILSLASNWYSINGYIFVGLAIMSLYVGLFLFLFSAVVQKTYAFYFQRVHPNPSKKTKKESKRLL